MQGMILNYVLLIIFGIMSIRNFSLIFRKKGTVIGFGVWIYTIAILAVFILALVATIVGMDYESLRIYIETSFRS